jgi:ribonuclease III
MDETKPWITFQENLNYHFKVPRLLAEALTHKSYAHEQSMNPGLFAHNERMEFLGDAVLDLAVSHMLMHRDFRATEGELSKRRASLVNEESLALLARKVGLHDFIILGKGERNTNGAQKDSILSSTFEAVIGAIYLDGNFENALKVLETLIAPLIDNTDLAKSGFDKDYKTRLQELLQGKFKTAPRYELEGASGPDHQKTFKVRVMMGDRVLGSGEGHSKKEAEQHAAQKALEEMI